MADLRDKREPNWPNGLYRRAGSYRFRRRVGGTYVVRVFGPITLNEATRKALRMTLDIEDGKEAGQVAPQVRKTFFAHSQEWLVKKKAVLGDGPTLQRYRAIVDNFALYLSSRQLSKAPLPSIDYAVCDDYVTHRRTAPIMPNGLRLGSLATKFTRKSACRNGAAKKTVYEERIVLKSVFKEAIRRKLIIQNPWEDVVVVPPKREEIRAKHNPLTEAECKALIAAATAEDQKRHRVPALADIIVYAINTGCREDEVCKVEWTDINFKERLIHVRAKKVVETRHKPDGTVETLEYEWKPKATQGDVPINNAVKAVLERLYNERKSNFVFAQPDGGSCRTRLLRLTQQAARDAGIKRIRFHDLRHTYGTLLREKGVSLEVIMQLMRHADMKETLLYAKPSTQAAHDAIKKLNVA